MQQRNRRPHLGYENHIDNRDPWYAMFSVFRNCKIEPTAMQKDHDVRQDDNNQTRNRANALPYLVLIIAWGKTTAVAPSDHQQLPAQWDLCGASELFLLSLADLEHSQVFSIICHKTLGYLHRCVLSGIPHIVRWLPCIRLTLITYVMW